MLRRNARKLVIGGFVLMCVAVLIALDMTQARRTETVEGVFQPEAQFPASRFDALTSATAKVAIVRSDYKDLPDPAPIEESDLTYPQIEDMVREAVRLSGGLDWLVHSGDMVLIKPNIVDPEPPGVGEVTDVRVVKAVIRLVNEVDPGNIEIVVGEGSPRPMDYELPYAPSWRSAAWKKIWDAAGFQTLLTDPDLEGIHLRLSNLNGSPPDNLWQDLVWVEVPGGGVAYHQHGEYCIHKDVLSADVFITVPVMKIHNFTGITVGMKNQIGIAPSDRYGFSKGAGVPQDDYAVHLHHSDGARNWVDEEIVDLCTIGGIDFVVVDALMCLETQKYAIREGGKIVNQVRRNMIVAGPDLVAVDHVCARLMGINPDDVIHLTLGAKVGLGVNDPDRIHIMGNTIEECWKRFKKAPEFGADFGQSCRTWLLKGPFSAQGVSEPMAFEFVEGEAHVRPEPGVDGWSEAIYFFDDHIELKTFFGKSEKNVVSYTFTYFDAPRTQEAELWLGSSEGMRIYLNGERVYDYSRFRIFGDGTLVQEKIPVQIKKGENTLLVKVLRQFGHFDFSLNICEPEPNPDYDGDRVWGLKFRTEALPPTAVADASASSVPQTFHLGPNYPNPFNLSTTISFSVPFTSSVRKPFTSLVIYNLAGQQVRSLLNRSMAPGDHRVIWDGRDENGAAVSSGIYLCRMRVGDGGASKSIKMSLIK